MSFAPTQRNSARGPCLAALSIVRWSVDEQTQRFSLTWSEKSGPNVEQPSRRGFGTRMIESLGQQLKGEVRLAYLPTGFVYELDVPRGSVIAAG